MTDKRSFGETKDGIGSYTVSDGTKRYRVVYRDGRRVKSKAGFRTKGAAKAWLRNTLVDLENGEHIETKRATETFGAYVERWLVKLAADPAIRQNTWSSYESNYRIHIKPTFGDTEFRHLDTEAVRTWHTKMKGKKKHGAKEPTNVLAQATCDEGLIGSCGASAARRWRTATYGTTLAASRRPAPNPSTSMCARNRRVLRRFEPWPLPCPSVTGRWSCWLASAGCDGANSLACNGGTSTCRTAR